MVLNNGLRPFLAKWHPLLQAWETKRLTDISMKQHEQDWTEEPKFREESDTPSEAGGLMNVTAPRAGVLN